MNNIINNDTIINTTSTNINYIIEGNYDFKKEMANNNDNGSNNNSINELCLVSQETKAEKLVSNIYFETKSNEMSILSSSV